MPVAPEFFQGLTHLLRRVRIQELNAMTQAEGEGVAEVRRRRAGSVAVWLQRVFVWGCFALTVGIAAWAAPRGFDFIDTGCYFLEYKFPADVADTHTTYHLVARPFFLLVGENITAFRCLSWILVWASALLFAWGWRRHLNTLYERENAPISLGTVLGMMLLASAANYTIKPAALTYNSLNFVGMAVALGLFFDGTARLMRREKTDAWLGIGEIAAGALAATVDILIKPTTAVFLVAAIVGYCLVSNEISLRMKKRLAGVAVAAGLAGVAAMVVFVGGIGPFLERIRTLVSIADNHAYMDELYARVWREFGELGAFLVHDLKYVAAAMVVGAITLLALRKRKDAFAKTAVVFGAIIFALWLHGTIAAKLWRGSHQLYFDGVVARLYLGAALTASAMALLSFLVVPPELRPAKAQRHAWPKILLWLLLVLTPFAGAFGTTTSIYLNGALYSVCWLAALFLALAELGALWRTRLLLPFATVPLAVYAVAQLFHGQIYMPYMNPRPLWEQTVPTVVGSKNSKVLLDQPASDFINQTRTILVEHGFKPGDDIFCFFNIPGLVYAVGGRSPIIPWYFGRIYVNNPVEEYYMQAAGPERRAHAWIITQADVAQFHDHFVRGGINFPDGYEEIGGPLVNPQSGLPVRIWKPRGSR